MLNNNLLQSNNETSNGGQPVGEKLEFGIGYGYLLSWRLIQEAFPNKSRDEQNEIIGIYQEKINLNPEQLPNILLYLESLSIKNKRPVKKKIIKYGPHDAQLGGIGKFSDVLNSFELCEG